MCAEPMKHCTSCHLNTHRDQEEADVPISMFTSRGSGNVLLKLFFISLPFFFISCYRSLQLSRFTIANRHYGGGEVHEKETTTKPENVSKNEPTYEIKSESMLLDGCGKPASSESSYVPNEFCSDEHRHAVEFCTNNTNNKVLMRQGLKQPIIKSWGQVRPYSIANISHDNLLPRCNSLVELLTAIKLGQRRWPVPEQSGTDTIPSTFVPYGCHAPTLPPAANETCAIFNQYGHVIIHGDSLASDSTFKQ